MLRNLDECGIIRIGACIQPDDIMCGKITPKGETQLTPEEKLLRAIFGDKARDVKNTSLKVPPGISGTIVDVKVFNRRSGDKDDRTRAIEEADIAAFDIKERKHIASLTASCRDKIWEIVKGTKVKKELVGAKKVILCAVGEAIEREALDGLPVKKLVGCFDKDENEQVKMLIGDYDQQVHFIKNVYDVKREKVTEGDDLPPGVIKMVKVYVAVKRKLSVGDKMAGRHGNKGVVSCIRPEEDMPFFEDGTPMDIVLNPLGVPSRMNIGQIMETHLGMAGRKLGQQVNQMLEESGNALKDIQIGRAHV